MADNLTDMMQREQKLLNSDTNNVNRGGNISRSLQLPFLSKKLSDHNNNNSNIGQQSYQQPPPLIITTDHSNRSSLSVMNVSHHLHNRQNVDTGYDSDGAIRTSTTSKHQNKINTSYAHLVSPRLPLKRTALPSSKQLSVISSQQHLSPQVHLNVNPSFGITQNQEGKDEESTNEGDTRRRRIRLGRHIKGRSPSTKSHEVHSNHSPFISRNDVAFTNTYSGRPFRLVFVRHGERTNQALGSDWFSKAFRTNTYKSYDPNLPIALPKRRSNEAYEFDPPLTVRGLKSARHTGRLMLNNNLTADVCLSSTSIRCIQTCERILAGMERRETIPIRIEPGLFECPHLHQKIADSFMTKTELVENGYNIKLEYRTLIQKVNAPETLDEYFARCATVMRGIIDRYGNHGGTVLIVTHAPGLLALTDAINGIRTNPDTFYRTVAAYPPLAVYTAEFDGTKWKHSDQPFLMSPHRK